MVRGGVFFDQFSINERDAHALAVVMANLAANRQLETIDFQQEFERQHRLMIKHEQCASFGYVSDETRYRRTTRQLDPAMKKGWAAPELAALEKRI